MTNIGSGHIINTYFYNILRDSIAFVETLSLRGHSRMNSAQAEVCNNCQVNSFMFSWVNSFLLLKIRSIETKAELNSTMIEIETRTQYFKFMKRRVKSLKIPLKNIKQIKRKRLLAINRVILTTNLDSQIVIPTKDKDLANKFVGLLKEKTGIV